MKIGIIGGGNMARTIVIGLISNKTKPDSIMVTDINEKKLADFKRYGVKTGTTEKVLKHGDVIIFAVKPNVYAEVLPECTGEDKLFISIGAGVSISYIKKILGDDRRVARVMPNTPALSGAGMTGICRDGLSDDDINIVRGIFDSVGKTVVTDESHIDAVCGVSGSGPAYVYTMIEAMADGGVLYGLSRADALTLAAQTVLGSAKMVLDTNMHPAELRDMVCSPGGTTIEGVRALENGGFRASVIDAVAACTEKSKKLGN